MADRILEQIRKNIRLEESVLSKSYYPPGRERSFEMKLRILAFFIVVLLTAGCNKASQTSNPAWLDQLIQQIENDPVANPPLSVWSYEYNGQVVYYVPSHCCDIPSAVFDAQGTYVCAPDGGFTGGGDGKCSDFFDKRTNEQLIWQDSRSR
jgi:hypothetical protein